MSGFEHTIFDSSAWPPGTEMVLARPHDPHYDKVVAMHERAKASRKAWCEFERAMLRSIHLERARRDRYNEKRRLARAAARRKK